MASSDEDKKTKQDKQQENKETVNVANIYINQILVQLHQKALEQVKDYSDFTIQNSAIDGNDKNAKFVGAGQHVIVALPKKAKDNKGNTVTIPISTALKMLTTYVQWFVGPDLKSTISEKDLIVMPADKDEKSDTGKDEKKPVKDSNIYIPSFSQYLLLEDATDAKGTADAKDAEDTKGSENKDKTQSSDDKELGQQAEAKAASGYYITYAMEIEGQKEHPLADALKKLATNIIDGIGFAIGHWRSGAVGDVMTIGDLKNDLASMFGSIDPDQLLSEYQKNLQQDFKHTQAQAQLYDTKTIINMLKVHIPSQARAKIKSAEYALCTRVDVRDKSYELFNQTKVANTITKSIQGIFKKFKNKLTNKDVILVNNYDDDEKNKSDNKFKKDKEDAKESVLANYTNLLLEDGNKVTPADVQKKLQQLCQGLKEYNASANVDTSEKIVKVLKKANIDEPTFFEELLKSKYSFLIRTKENIKLKESNSNNTDILLAKLFEKKLQDKEYDSKVLEKIKKIFQNLITTFKTSAKDKNLIFKATETLVPYVSEEVTITDNVNDSITKKYLLNMLFEDNDLSLLDEKDHKRLDDNKFKEFQTKIHGNLDDIRKNKDKIIKQSYTNPQTNKLYSWTSGEDAQRLGYDKFIKELFDSSDDEDTTLKKLKSIAFPSDRNNFKDDIVTRFKYKKAEETTKDKQFTVIFKYPPDPSDENKIEQIEGDLGEQKVKAGEAAKEPEKPEIEGWNFKKWSDSFDNVTEDMMIVAEYAKKINIIPKAPKDPEKPKDVEPIGDPIPYDPSKSLKEQLPKLPEIKGWKADGWDPAPDTIKDPTEDIEIIGKYKKEDSDNKEKIDVFYVIPDENGILAFTKYKVQFVIPDFKDPTDKTKWKDFEEQQTIDATKMTEDGKEFKYPEKKPEPIDGHNFIEWNPTQDDFKKNTLDTYVNDKYTKEDKDGNKIICIQAVFDGAGENKVEIKKTGLDFYIAPMKGLKYKDGDLDRNNKK